MVHIIPASRQIAEFKTQYVKSRVPLYHPDFPFIIFWSPKAACTPVSRWFFLQTGMFKQEMLNGVQVHLFEKEYRLRRGYLKELYRTLRRKKKPVIKFVRDPYARAYSSYLELCTPQAAEIKSYWGYWTRRQIIRDLTGNDDVHEYAFSFLQYLRWLVRQDMSAMNSHIRPQHLERDTFFPLRLCRIEQLSTNFSALEAEFSLPHSIGDHPEILESKHFHKKSAIDKDTARALLEFGVPTKKSEDFSFVKFDAELAAGTEYERLIRKCFPKDVELYGYSKKSSNNLMRFLSGWR